MLRVVEIFTSIQGESTQAGRKCFFIRLEGCNLSCRYCDTLYAASGGVEKSIGELVSAAESSGTRLVEITGGEPLFQQETPLLCEALLSAGFEVMMETNGSLPIDRVSEKVRRIVDYKLPDSGMHHLMFEENFRKITAHDEVKFVVSSRRDFEYAEEVCRRFELAERTGNLLVSPVWGNFEFSELAQWILESDQPLRMQLQFHKIIWGNRPGV